MTLNPVPADFVHGQPESASQARPNQPPSWWRRIWSHPWMTQYHRLFALLVLVNGLLAYQGWQSWRWWESPQHAAMLAISRMMLANFALAILIRQQYVVNLLFWLATRAPTSWPLAIRWQLAKVYHFGGLHSGGCSLGTIWFALLLATQLWHVGAGGQLVSTLTMGLGAALLLLLIAIIGMALPGMRARNHNRFEKMHRFGGWTALLIFWAHLLSTLADSLPVGQSWSKQGEIWLLSLLTLSILLPWLRLKRVEVQISKPSNHALVVKYDYGDNAIIGSSNTVSLKPLLEWHSFANIPAPGSQGFRQIISRAGDWTGALIDHPPRYLWVKGISTCGVAYIEVLFKRVVYIATGSGIGPVLPHLLAKQLPMQLIWATRNPRMTYGEAVLEEILQAIPDAVIWDTDCDGKPDLVKLALGAVRASGAEAVICISNRKLTEQVIQGVELQGIPCYGAIWDS